MEREQESEWAEAQKLAVSVDLVEAAKRQLKFLAAVDRNRHLYKGPALDRAIYRYNVYWLPLLAKHTETPLCEGPLVVPFDCEWVWHCHRLNPVRYKSDCEEYFGKFLDNSNVVSLVQECSKKEQTEEIWSRLYPEEPYELNFMDEMSRTPVLGDNCSKYDLVTAVQRQAPFYYQVSRPHVCNDLFLREAVARYKGFLHLIKRNKEKSLRRFCVPTYDIDLIWHSHQLHPISYGKDLTKIIGKVLEHDDTDSDRSKGKKLDVGFSETTQQWEETFGLRYWRAGAMYRGTAPKPVVVTSCPYNYVQKKKHDESSEHQKFVNIPVVKIVEVLLEFVEIKNIPQNHKGNLSVSFSKKQPDMFFNVQRNLSILSLSGEKQVASFHCEPTGELLFELISHSPSSFKVTKASKTLCSASLSLGAFLDADLNLSVERWIEMVPVSYTTNANPVLLRVAASFTIPTPSSQILHVLQSQSLFKRACFLPITRRVHQTKARTRVVDDNGNDVLSLQMRVSSKERNKLGHGLGKEVIGMTGTGQTHSLAELVEEGFWSFKGSHFSFRFQRSSGNSSHLFELVGDKMVKLYPGRRLEYEPKHCHNRKKRSEQDFVTAVEFSSENPYGKAVALFDLRSGTFTVEDEWMMMPGIISAFLLSNLSRREGHNGSRVNEDTKEITEGINKNEEDTKSTISTTISGKNTETKAETV